MLGKSESANMDEMFSIIDRDHRIYTKRETARRRHQFPARASMPGRGHRWRAGTVTEPRDSDLGKAVVRILLAKYNPAAVLVDEGLEVLEVRGDANPFFRLPVGKVSFHLLKLIPDLGLFLEIEKLVRQAAKSGETARRAGVPYESDGSIREVNIEVTPLYGHQKRALLVDFRACTESGGTRWESRKSHSITTKRSPAGTVRSRS